MEEENTLESQLRKMQRLHLHLANNPNLITLIAAGKNTPLRT